MYDCLGSLISGIIITFNQYFIHFAKAYIHSWLQHCCLLTWRTKIVRVMILTFHTLYYSCELKIKLRLGISKNVT